MDNWLEEKHFADLVKDAKSVVGFSDSHQIRVGRNEVTKANMVWQSSIKYSFKMKTCVQGQILGFFSHKVLQDSRPFRS